ncbi:hypothetical protein MM221_15295 [Salipaludibacillus sp. LMS25]|uniref:hypothetical protein n=1 Tax=Salipaludibacillus sp. LMS25 TaxID=2924031 RepID=UPI0020D0230B|nr:hypothetical protein [Salipaludibacillus sp. LMS25]UJW57026.1 hypothetical protein HXZ66_06125 [Bacillus sp. A116_S68]UTR13963.1 hypothetical protein MM221_15295 [Salipaludibacillus sp. LMS25]
MSKKGMILLAVALLLTCTGIIYGLDPWVKIGDVGMDISLLLMPVCLVIATVCIWKVRKLKTD